MVAVPLFGNSRSDAPAGTHDILLDGPAASSIFSVVDDAESLIADRRLLSWSWSSNLTHSLIADRKTDTLLGWRWDRPEEIKRWPLPDQTGAGRILESLASEPAPSAETVISKMLRIFWMLRNDIEGRGGTEKDVIRAFNALLVWADAVRRGLAEDAYAAGLLTLREIVPVLRERNLIEFGSRAFSSDSVRSLSIGGLLDTVLARDPSTDLALDPDLFIRHAAGVLYEAAHISLDKKSSLGNEQQVFSFADFSVDETPAAGEPSSDVHFTPSSLARALAQEAIREIERMRRLPAKLRVLDPACGSGAFLIEALREVTATTPVGVSLKGIDRSPVARIVTKFCLRRSIVDDGRRERDIKVILGDSLRMSTWGKPHLILMNPPFRQWEEQPDDDKGMVRSVLRDRAGRLPDYSYAW